MRKLDVEVPSSKTNVDLSEIVFFLGTNDYINWRGIEHYRLVITELLKNGIEPMVTIFHWDLPQPLQDRGGFMNEEIVEWYAAFATIVFRELGDLVKIWTTFNEPKIFCTFG